ncbi:class I SAM-dependent methyltransferase [Amycolatopsis sp. DG1A-15b]|uniref:class I SAM-dependent methyltransferase n=1 Tax=Amycolatopsis sp. DG1A-15b TaxID=3052846 RepID=UPI00255BD8D1|nr:class I SAM-dependent methyltransferase [Amycolatopsis sp. DG1A-15b]WIX90236.1 class I SAM-dependent methyltransferase [Amycolatopsis sp. DG1A-15b]
MAESFGTDAERYDRARPEYPRELVDRVVAASPGPDVLDVGCGTGIEARQFRAAGCRVLGIDPDERMAAFARQGGIDVEVAKFEDWAPAGRTFDAVVAGQAWHWVDPATGPAKAARVLRPGGLLAVFAHVFQPPAEVAAAFAAACRRVLPGSPFAGESRPAAEIYDVMFTGFADAIAKEDGLGTPDRWHFEWERTYTRPEWLDFLPTTGGLTRLPPEKLSEVLSEVGAAIDGLGGSFVLPYTTLAVVATRLDK